MKLYNNSLIFKKLKSIASTAILVMIIGCGEGGGKEVSLNHGLAAVDNAEKFHDENSEIETQKNVRPNRIPIWSEADQKTYQYMLDSGKSLISIKVPRNPNCELISVSHFPQNFGNGTHIGSEYILDISIIDGLSQAVNMPIVITCSNGNWDSINLYIKPHSKN